MSTSRVLIVDDEPLAREGAKHLVALDPELTVVGVCANGRQAIRALQTMETDIVLLDVQMPKVSGFDVIDAIGIERMPVVVFMTAYESHAIRAFEAHAVDYLLKPYTDRRFAAALDRAKTEVRHRSLARSNDALADLLRHARAGDAPPDTHASYREQVVVRSAGATWYVPVEEIEWIEAADYYARLHTGGRGLLTRESLHSLAIALDPRRFLRVHRSAIVNLARVRGVKVDRSGRTFVSLLGEQRVPLARSYRAALEGALLSRSRRP